ncbi:hypothetical protein EJ110_NYTH58552 [Nymphaea thermarum]|nr:hypothetical protein EJ110_NYTH58552 [Nymphaea thermarum]
MRTLRPTQMAAEASRRFSVGRRPRAARTVRVLELTCKPAHLPLLAALCGPDDGDPAVCKVGTVAVVEIFGCIARQWQRVNARYYVPSCKRETLRSAARRLKLVVSPRISTIASPLRHHLSSPHHLSAARRLKASQGKTGIDLSRFSFFEIWAFSSCPPLLTTKMMPRQKYYVVFEGRERGIYDSWERCQPLVYRYKGVVFKSFDSLEVAENHMYEYVHKKYGVQVSRPPLIEDVTAKQDIEDTKFEEQKWSRKCWITCFVITCFFCWICTH